MRVEVFGISLFAILANDAMAREITVLRVVVLLAGDITVTSKFFGFVSPTPSVK